jgi:phage terminase large subunit-like protein
MNKPKDSDVIKRAIKSGPSFEGMNLTAWKTKPVAKLTAGERVCRFAMEHLKIPEGKGVGQPLVLDAYQVAFVLAVFDNPKHSRKAILSIARRNGKTFVVAVILLAYIVGPLAVQNSVVASAALSRDQAALCFRLMSLMLQQSPSMEGLYRIVPSSKRIVGMRKNVEYLALSADAKTGHGKSIRILLLDEAGQVVEASNEYIDMLVSSQGSYDDARMFIISTQAPSDGSYLSLEIDAAAREDLDNVVAHVYAADPDCDLMDERQWFYSNPGLGKYRSVNDLRDQIRDAIALPAKLPGVMNLLLNMRVSQQAMFISPEVWKGNSDAPNLEVFREAELISLGLDLSIVSDLTCAVLAAKDGEGRIHLLTFAFSPLGGIRERSLRDRVPYDEWARTGVVYAPPGDTLNYDLIVQHLRVKLSELGIRVDAVYFDRYRIDIFKAACEREGFASDANFVECGQGFVSMASMIDGFETALLERRICHGAHPILNLGAASAIVEIDNVGNRRLTKKKSANKIDGIIAALMACKPHVEQIDPVWDISSMVG